jgi:hypothetical protein
MSKNGFVTSLIGSRSFYGIHHCQATTPPHACMDLFPCRYVEILLDTSCFSFSHLLFGASPHLGAFMIIPESPDSFPHVMFGKLPESAGDALWSI